MLYIVLLGVKIASRVALHLHPFRVTYERYFLNSDCLIDPETQELALSRTGTISIIMM
jgi:hypothetical protein